MSIQRCRVYRSESRQQQQQQQQGETLTACSSGSRPRLSTSALLTRPACAATAHPRRRMQAVVRSVSRPVLRARPSCATRWDCAVNARNAVCAARVVQVNCRFATERSDRVQECDMNVSLRRMAMRLRSSASDSTLAEEPAVVRLFCVARSNHDHRPEKATLSPRQTPRTAKHATPHAEYQ